MNTNSQDQWFNPGDKVMRVAYGHALGLPVDSFPVIPETEFGKVLCVESCVQRQGINRVFFVGIKSQTGRPWFAACFRRVTEIQLCVRAANRMSEPVEETQNA